MIFTKRLVFTVTLSNQYKMKPGACDFYLFQILCHCHKNQSKMLLPNKQFNSPAFGREKKTSSIISKSHTSMYNLKRRPKCRRNCTNLLSIDGTLVRNAFEGVTRKKSLKFKSLSISIWIIRALQWNPLERKILWNGIKFHTNTDVTIHIFSINFRSISSSFKKQRNTDNKFWRGMLINYCSNSSYVQSKSYSHCFNTRRFHRWSILRTVYCSCYESIV